MVLNPTMEEKRNILFLPLIFLLPGVNEYLVSRLCGGNTKKFKSITKLCYYYYVYHSLNLKGSM